MCNESRKGQENPFLTLALNWISPVIVSSDSQLRATRCQVGIHITLWKRYFNEH